jgi:hypothetical protein
MISNNPIRWTDPATWPWIVWLWAALLLVGWIAPMWRWLKRRRASGWPAVDGRIESVAVTKPRFSFTTKRGYYVAEFAYSYSVDGTPYSGRYKREFPTEREAEEFVRDLQGKPVSIHYNPASPSGSVVLESDLENLLQNRAPSPTPQSSAVDTIPQWFIPVRWVFVWIAGIGLVVSVSVHIAAVMGRPVSMFFWVLHAGIFVVWIPTVLVGKKLVGDLNRKDFWKVTMKDVPNWMRYMMYVFLAYAMVNFLFSFANAPSKGNIGDAPSSVWRGFSGHWMAFYSAALAMLYAAARAVDASPRCPNGHFSSHQAIYCKQCGQPVLRVH